MALKQNPPVHIIFLLWFGNKISALHPGAAEISGDVNAERQARGARLRRMPASPGKPLHGITDPSNSLRASPPAAASTQQLGTALLRRSGWGNSTGDGGVSSVAFFNSVNFGDSDSELGSKNYSSQLHWWSQPVMKLHITIFWFQEPGNPLEINKLNISSSQGSEETSVRKFYC